MATRHIISSRRFAKVIFSTIGHAKLNGPLEVEDRRRTLIGPSSAIDKQGIEDARIVKEDYTFYMSYFMMVKMR
jgi:predicted GH43/DUF377 family glycosyl hydrolase